MIWTSIKIIILMPGTLWQDNSISPRDQRETSINVCNFNVSLANNVISFEQLGPVLTFGTGEQVLCVSFFLFFSYYVCGKIINIWGNLRKPSFDIIFNFQYFFFLFSHFNPENIEGT